MEALGASDSRAHLSECNQDVALSPKKSVWATQQSRKLRKCILPSKFITEAIMIKGS